MFTKKWLGYCMLHPVVTILVAMAAAGLLLSGGAMMCRGRHLRGISHKEIRC